MMVEKLTTNQIVEFKQLIEIFCDVFEMESVITSDQYLGRLLANQDFMVFVVKVNNEIVGGLTIYVLHQYYQDKPQAYIYDVGIKKDFQRKGLGKILINEVNSFCFNHGFALSYVEAEADDLDAVNFYRNTNVSDELTAVHFTYQLNKL
jgi:aminoglycoside 3-N-acetyltransferase I